MYHTNMLSVRIQHCTNCGIQGHLFRNCPEPVTSYGVIAMRHNPTHPPHSIEFLLIKRKDSISFIELIRGKYNPNDLVYIATLLKNMTIDEQRRLLACTFEDIWHSIWGNASKLQSHKNDYKKSEERFLMLRPLLDELIAKNQSVWEEPEWGFPKGRRNTFEKDIHCAIREFKEETGLRDDEFNMIYNTQSIVETYVGTNNVTYCHKYYLAVCTPDIEVRLDQDNIHMTREIGDIRWLSFDDAFIKIRPGNAEKREILVKAKRIITQFHMIDI